MVWYGTPSTVGTIRTIQRLELDCWTVCRAFLLLHENYAAGLWYQ